jgi:hypothetical protein
MVGGRGVSVLLHSVTKRDATTAVHEMEIQFTFYELRRFRAKMAYVLFLVLAKIGIITRKREAVTGGWRKLHSKDIHNLYCPTSTI